MYPHISIFLFGKRKTIHVFWVLFCVLLGKPLFGVDVLPEEPVVVPETISINADGSMPVHRIILGNDFNDRATNPTQIQSVVDWNDWFIKPSKGTFAGEKTSQGKNNSGYYIDYMPYLHAEGADSFQWTAKGLNGVDKNFTCHIEITPANDDLKVYSANKEQSTTIVISFDEEQNDLAAFEIFDPDPSNAYSDEDESNWPVVTLTGEHVDLFELVPDSAKQMVHANTSPARNGWSWSYNLKVKGTPFNFEASDFFQYNLELNVEDIIDQNTFEINTYSITANLEDVDEIPELSYISPLSEGTQILELEEVFDYQNMDHTSYNYTLLEGKDTSITIPFKVDSPNDKKLLIRYETDRLKDEDGDSILPVLETVTISQEGESVVTLYEDDDKWGGRSSVELNQTMEGNITISFPLADSFCEPTTYRFYVKDESGSAAIQSDATGKLVPFLTAKIEILNDYSDEISLELVYPSGTTGDGTKTSPIFLQPYRENSIDIVADFNITDADSWPVEDLRQDNNSSTIQGALVQYNLSWLDANDALSFTDVSPNEIFSISNDGILSFKNSPDYDILYPNDLIFRLKVEVLDSTLGNSSEHTRTSDVKYIEFSVADINEEPLFHDISGKITEAPSFNIKTPEDVTWVWDYSERDEDDQSLFISAKDLDASTSSYQEPEWQVSRQSILGIASVSGVKPGQRSQIIVPDLLTFTPFENKTGVDYFELSYGNSDDVVRFDINITNLPDSPVLDRLVNKRGSTGEVVIEVDREVFSYDLNFSEAEGLMYELEFADKEDLDDITELSIVEILDYKLFNFDREDIDGSKAFQRVTLSLKEPQDYENFQDKNFDGIYSITLKVGDGILDPINYTLNFSIQDENEGPLVTLPPPTLLVPTTDYGYFTTDQIVSVKEEQKLAIPGIEVSDPEGETGLEFVWSIEPINDGALFEISKSRGEVVDLQFKDGVLPSWENEDQRDLNVTIKIRDTGVPSGVSYLSIPIELADVNDPPHFLLDEISVTEPNHVVVDDLLSGILFVDEDGHSMTPSLDLSQADNSYFEIIGNQLVLNKGYSDHEEKDSYDLFLTVTDEKGAISEKLIEVIIKDLPEPPEVRDSESDDDDIFFNDAIVTTKTFQIFEDAEYMIDSLIFYDPEDISKDPNNLSFSTIGDYEGTLTVVRDDNGKKNGTFIYIPPQDYYSPDGETLSVDLNVSDGEMFSVFTFVFDVEDVPDPPKITFELDPEISFWDSSDTTLLLNNEGYESVAIVQADDSMDSKPSLNFDWELRGYDSNLFTLQTRLEGKKEMFLDWNLTALGGLPPDYGLPPINPQDGKQRSFGHKFELEIIVYGDANKSIDSKNRTSQSILIEIYDRPEEPPFFTDFEVPPYPEGSTSSFVGTIQAIDPDDAELRLNGKQGNDIHYFLENSNVYDDYVLFNQDLFNTDPLDSSNQPGGELHFADGFFPDYETLVNSRSGPKYEILVKAKEWDPDAEEYVDGAETEQVIVINLLNQVEEPYFESLDTLTGDANFSLEEGETNNPDLPLRVSANTVDYNKNLTIQLPDNPDRDNHLFGITAVSGNEDRLAYADLFFLNPPDREAPRDLDKDNSYQVELKIETEDPTVFALETFTIAVTDADFPFTINLGESIKHPENHRFVAQIDVTDSENSEILPDLLLATHSGVYYSPNVSMDFSDQDPHFSEIADSIAQNLSDVHGVASADINNDGAFDVIALHKRSVKILYNSGFGSFETPVDLLTSGSFPGEPRKVLLQDFDQNGFCDVVLSFVSTGTATESGIYYFKNRDGNFDEPIELTTVESWGKPVSLEVLDVDNDYDLDLVVADIDTDQVSLFINEDGNFSFDRFLLTDADGLSDPRILKACDLGAINLDTISNPHLRPDLLVGASGKIFVLKNNEESNFTLLDPVIVTASGGSSPVVKDIRVADLDSNNLADIIFIDSQNDHASYTLQKAEFQWTSPEQVPGALPPAESIEVFNHLTGGKLQPILMIGTSSPPRIFQFKAPNEVSNGIIDFVLSEEIELSGVPDDSAVQSIQLADLNYAYNFFDFEIIAGDYDYEFFDLDRFKSQGKLFFKSYPDYESSDSEDRDRLYEVEIKVSKTNQTTGEEQSETKTVMVKLLDVNEAPEFFGGAIQSGSFSHRENFLEVLELNVSNPETAESLVYEIIDYADGNLFYVEQETGKLFFRDRIRWEEQPSFEVQIKVTDKLGDALRLSTEMTLQISLEDGYELPVVAKNELTFSLSEDPLSPLLIDVSDFNVTDHPDNSLNGISDEINVTQFPSFGTVVIENNEFRYTPDANYSGEDKLVLEFYNLYGLPASLSITLGIQHQEDPPIVLTPLEIKHPEGDLNVTTLRAYDSDPLDKNSLTWKMLDPDDPNFEILGKNNLFFKFRPDYEIHGEQLFLANLVLSDGEHNVSHSITVNLEDIPDALPSSTLSMDKVNLFRVMEGHQMITNLELFDSDGPESPTARVVAGLDSTFFTISGDELRVKNSIDLSYEEPEDFNTDNIYEFKVLISDGLLSQQYPVFVQLLDSDENAPYFTTQSSNGEILEYARFEVFENQTKVGFLRAEDVEKSPSDLRFKIFGGTDEDLFVLNQYSGEITFKNAPNYEARSSNVGGTMIERPFELEVEVTDGYYSTTQSVSITVKDVNDLPEIQESEFSLNEDSSLEKTLILDDEDGEEHLIQASVQNTPSHGSLDFNNDGFSFSYVPESNYFGEDSFTLLLTDDQEESATRKISLTILPVNDPPVATDDFFYYFNEDENFTVPLDFSVASNDHSGPDHNSEEELYQFEVVQSVDDGRLLLGSEQGEYSYLPDMNATLGPDSFSYQVVDSDLNATAVATIWRAILPAFPQWIYLRNFGLFYHQQPTNDNAWIYHEKMGWLYISEFSKIYDASWIWHDLIGWFWSGDWNADLSRARWFYSDAAEMWLHWEGGVREKQGWFTRDYANQVYDEDFFTRLNIRNEILEILPDYSALVEYISNNSYFKRAEIVSIIGELNRFRQSNTLDAILGYEIPY